MYNDAFATTVVVSFYYEVSVFSINLITFKIIHQYGCHECVLNILVVYWIAVSLLLRYMQRATTTTFEPLIIDAVEIITL